MLQACIRNHNNNNKATEPIASVVSHANQDSEMKQFLKKIYNEGKVEKLEDKEDDKSWLTSLYDYLWGDDSDEDEVTEDLQEETVNESKLYNELDGTNKKIEKTLRE